MGTGEADCHGQCAHWPRNDRGFAWVRHKIGGRTGASAPTKGCKGCGGLSGGGVGAPRPTDLQEILYKTGAGGVEPRPYGSFGGWCGRDDVGIGPYGGSWGESGREKARGALGSPGRVERGSYKGE